MILQALTTYYEDLAKQGRISNLGWGEAKVSYALVINGIGDLTDVISLVDTDEGETSVLKPKAMRVPMPAKRSGRLVAPRFLCDNSAYLLGIDSKGDPEQTLKCFEACKELHIKVLQDSDEPAAIALTTFFNKWVPEKAHTNAALMPYWDNIITGTNLIFHFEGVDIQDNKKIGQLWERYYTLSTDGPEMTCLVTGKKGPVERTHPFIKGIKDAQSSGAALISFNESAFCSYGKTQNYNAPMSKYASFAYTSALNYLIADKEHIHYVGDTAVLCWAEGGEPAYQGFASACLFGTPQNYSEKDILDKMKRLASGKKVEYDESRLDPMNPFYILGIAPNAARLSIRFFYKDSFGSLLNNINEHHQRMEIVRPKNDTFQTISVRQILYETINSKPKDKAKSKEKEVSHVMTGEVMRSILTNLFSH